MMLVPVEIQVELHVLQLERPTTSSHRLRSITTEKLTKCTNIGGSRLLGDWLIDRQARVPTCVGTFGGGLQSAIRDGAIRTDPELHSPIPQDSKTILVPSSELPKLSS